MERASTIHLYASTQASAPLPEINNQVQLIRPQNHLVSAASIFIPSREEFTTTESATIGYHDCYLSNC
jgi:hypothetical protein